MDSSDDELRPSFQKSNKKKFDLYGVFSSEIASSEEEEIPKARIHKKHFLNFQKSGETIAQSKKGVQVYQSINSQKQIASSEEDEYEIEDLQSRHITSQKKIKISPEKKFFSQFKSESIKEKDMESHYGIAFQMMKNMGYDVNKGLGKNKQGRVEPVMAVEKKAMTTNYDLQVQSIGKPQIDISINQNLDDQMEEEDQVVIIKRWERKIHPTHKKQEEEPQKEERIIDMRSNIGNEKTLGAMSLFLSVQKKEWIKEKNKYQKLIKRKQLLESNNEEILKEKNENNITIEKQTLQKQILAQFLQAIQQIKFKKDLQSLIFLAQQTYSLSKTLFQQYKMGELFLFYFCESLQSLDLILITQKLLTQIKQILDIIFPNLLENQDTFKQQEFKTQSDYLFSSILEKSLLNRLNLLCVQSLEQFLDFLESSGKLPDCFIKKLTENALLKSLTQAITNKQQPKDISRQIFPFLQFLLVDDREQLISSIYTHILNTFPTIPVLEAYDQILPFQDVLGEDRWKNLVLRQILPKLLFILNKVEINPSDQKIDILEMIFKWLPGLLDAQILILFKSFFQKILKIAIQWKAQKGDIQEMNEWIQGWNIFLPQRILILNKDMINKIQLIIQKE